MSEKEKNLVAFLGLIVSIAIFIVVVCYAFDFSEMKVKSLGDKMMNNLSESQYEKFYDNFSNNGSSKLDQITEYQENINKSLGDVKKYKFIKTNKNQVSKEEDYISIEYDVNFSKFLDEPVRINLVFLNSDNKWQASEYKIISENINKTSELANNINYLNFSIKTEEDNRGNDAKKIVSEVIQSYEKGDYKYIYSILSNDLKEKGNEDEFIKYLQNQYDKYGQTNNIKFNGYEISRDKSEYKINYSFDDSKSNKKVFITFWINIKDKSYLSGIKFSEYA